MRNVEFREDKGPGIVRRILAFLLVVLGVAAATAYTLVLSPRTYSSALTLLQNQPEASDRLPPRPSTRQSALRSSPPPVCRRKTAALTLKRPCRAWSSRKSPTICCKLPARDALPGLTDHSVGPQTLQALENAMKDASGDRTKRAQRRACRAGGEEEERPRPHRRPHRVHAQDAPRSRSRAERAEAAGNGTDWPDGGWQAAFETGGETGRIVADLEQQLAQARGSSRQIHRDRAIAAELDKYIRAPENQTVTRKAKTRGYEKIEFSSSS